MDLVSPRQVQLDLAKRVRDRRKERGWSRAELAHRSGVAFGTLKVFELSGRISLTRLVLIAAALGSVAEFDALFKAPVAASLEELERRARLRASGRRR